MVKPVYMTCPTVHKFKNLSQATIVDNRVLLSAMVGMDTEMNVVGGLSEQAHKTLSNIRDVLQYCGSDLQYVYSMNIFLDQSLSDAQIEEFNAIYRTYFPVEAERPIRCLVQCKLAGLFVEIVNVQAYLKD